MRDLFDQHDKQHPRSPKDRPARGVQSGGDLLQQFFRSQLSPAALRRLRWELDSKRGGGYQASSNGPPTSQASVSYPPVRRAVVNTAPLVVEPMEEQEDPLVVNQEPQDGVKFVCQL